MSRQERRAIQKLGKRRLRWLERERRKDGRIDKIVTELEEDFDEDEVEMAKVFFADYLTNSGSFAGTEDQLYTSQLEKICKDYDLEPADAMLILDTAEDTFAASKSEETKHEE